MQYLDLYSGHLKRRNYRKMESFYYSTEIINIAEILPNRLYFGIVEGEKALINTADTIFFNIDKELVYMNYYYDFGPLNISCLYKYCQKLNNYMSMPNIKRVVHYTTIDPNKKVNSAYLIGAFAILYLGMAPREVYRILLGAGGLYRSFVDASQGSSIYMLRLVDCLQAIERARTFNFFDFNDFNVGEYDTHDKLQNGDMNWLVPRKFLAFIGPTDGEVMTTHSPDFYLAYFIKNDIRTVIRLNNKVYNAEVFKQVGIEHHELFFQDGSVPPKAILKQFLHIAENAPGAIAVHCKAGLGRTGSLIGAYIMKHYKMTAKEAIAWMRICRPGSVIGQQQGWLEKIEGWLWRQGSNYRMEHFGDGDKIPHHRFGIYSTEWQQERDKLRKQSRMKQNPELSNTCGGAQGKSLHCQTAKDFSCHRNARSSLDTTSKLLTKYPIDKTHLKPRYLAEKSPDYKTICNMMSKVKGSAIEKNLNVGKLDYQNTYFNKQPTNQQVEETQGDKLISIKANRIANILPTTNVNKFIKDINLPTSSKRRETENIPPNKLKQNHMYDHFYSSSKHQNTLRRTTGLNQVETAKKDGGSWIQKINKKIPSFLQLVSKSHNKCYNFLAIFQTRKIHKTFVKNMSQEVRQNVLKLMERKDKIETEIKELTSVLNTNGVGMDDPLVDAEGFPISSIDIYQVRHARHQIICLQNDHKALMKEIEAGLQGYYSSVGAENSSSQNNTQQNSAPRVLPKIPFAKVTLVSPGSPAEVAGMQQDDLLVEFGSLTCDNFKAVTDIATVVQHSEDKQIHVRVLRKIGNENRFYVTPLIPRKWNGKGLLGCSIVQLENIER